MEEEMLKAIRQAVADYMYYVALLPNRSSMRSYASPLPESVFEAVEHSAHWTGWNDAAKEAECEDCGLPYSDFMLDVTLSDEQWLAIHPSGINGLLCAQCIVARASKLSNIVAVRATLELG